MSREAEVLVPASRRSMIGAGLGALGGAAALTALTATPAAASATDAEFWAFGPSRIADTRTGTRITTGRMRGGQTRTVSLADQFITGYDLSLVANIMVAQTAGSGNVRAWQNGTTRPTVANVQWWGKGQTLVNLAVFGLSSTNVSFDVYCSGGTKTAAHVVVDLFGYFYRDGVAAKARPPVEL